MENYMKFKRLSITFLVLLFVLVSCKGGDDDITVFENGNTEYVIVTDSDASYAVSNLAYSFGQLFGASPTVLSDEMPEKKLEILIGHTSRGVTAEYIYELHSLSSKSFSSIVTPTSLLTLIPSSSAIKNAVS